MGDYSMKNGRMVRAFPVDDQGGAVLVGAHLDRLFQAYGAVLKLPERLAEKAKAVSGDQNLTDVGKRTALTDWVREHGAPVLRQVATALKDAEARRAEIEGTMTGGVVDKTDVAAALVRQETRAWLRAMKPAERATLLSGIEPVDPLTAAAIIEAPPQLSGVLQEQRERLIKNFAATRHPEAARKLQDIEQAAEAVGSAWRAAAGTIESNAGSTVLRELEASAGLRAGELGGTRDERVATIRSRLPGQLRVGGQRQVQKTD